jgi:hypothetical protein
MAKSTPMAATGARQEAQGGDGLGDIFQRLQRQVAERTQQFRAGPITAAQAFALEKDLKTLVDAAARECLEREYNHLEPQDKKQAAPRVRYHKANYRINKKTQATVATLFGPITLWSFLYLHEDDGEPGLHPLHVQLGIVANATTALAERVGRWAVDHSQSAVRALLWNEHRLKWSNDHLRGVLRAFRQAVVAFQHDAQVARLLQWLDAADRSRGRHRPVLALGRDGVMVPIRGHGYQEASAGTLSVYDRRGKRLGTVYLGQMPEAHQRTMTQTMTTLLTAVLEQWSGSWPRLVYVTDKGKAQDDYWRQLRKLKNPRRPFERLQWDWVLDFFHVCGYVSKLAEALLGRSGKKGPLWFKRMRRWLREREHGVTQILRSAMQHYQRRKISKAATAEFWKAYRYLRRHSRWMGYARYRRQGLPLGSGVTEAACKTVFTQRLKRSGMRWHKQSAQVIVDLRVLWLSGIWDDVVQRDLQARPKIERLDKVKNASYRPQTRKPPRKAA